MRKSHDSFVTLAVRVKMDLNKYEVLLRVVDLGNMTQAALELNYTQSGISHMVKDIEEEFGFKLFIRSKKGVTLTREGIEIMPRIRALVEASDSLRQSVANVSGIQIGSVRIAAFQSVASTWILPVVREFHEQYPNIEIRLVDGTSDEMERMLLDRRIDLGIFVPSPRTKLQKQVLKNDPYLAVVPPNHPLACLQRFPIEEFSNYNFILGSMSTTLRALRDAQVEVHSSFSAVDNWTAIDMVEAGMGLSLIPELELSLRKGTSVIAITLEEPIYREIALLWPSEELGPAATLFLDYCQTIIPEVIAKDSISN